MSSLINKAKEALSKNKKDGSRDEDSMAYGTDNSHEGGRYSGTAVHDSTNAGPHSSNMGNRVDPRVDSDRDHRNDPSSTFGSNTSGGQYTGNTMSGSTNDGPHSSNYANKMDPRVDSDRDNRNDPSSRVGGYGTQDNYGSSGANPTSTSGYGSHSQSGYSGTTSSNTGPHGSNLANKLDPRVDSDMDNRNDPSSRVGGYGTQDNHGGSGQGLHGQTMHDHTTHSQPMHAQAVPQPEYGSSTSGNTGPHNSSMMNKLDPRVDSDMDNRNDPTSRVGGYGTQDNYGSQGGNPMSSGHTGHQQTGYGSSGAPPQYGDSGLQSHGQGHHQGHNQGHSQEGYGSGTTSSTHQQGGQDMGSDYTPGSGNTRKTAGPYNSDIMNKLDPRVDSDMDGSKTYGGNKTNY